jgi:asparagine synthase (glutamine-hydrolysing)
MMRLVEHRGPDGAGVWTAPSGRACFGHRRLAVIDLQTGQQPMVSDSGHLGVVLNGEIYNYIELRHDLARRGVPFQTQSDTEVLLRILERDWEQGVHALRGMFAFAAWDDRRGELLMARDRVGKKPLFYAERDGCLYFASTMEALRHCLPGAWAVDPQAIDAYLTLSYVPAPLTAYRGVGKLPAGTQAIVTEGRGGVTFLPYWELASSDPFEGSQAEAIEVLDELLNEAVAIRLRSDVPLGVFLSGGVDSSLVTAVAARQTRHKMRTFSIGFDVPAFDESAYAADVAVHLGTEHHECHVDAELLHLLPDVVRQFGEPFADVAALPLWLLARQTREHVTVVLGGDGGDEGFGGYGWYLSAQRLFSLAGWVPKPFARVGAIIGREGQRVMGRPWRVLHGMQRVGELCEESSDAERFAAMRAVFGTGERERLYTSELANHRSGRHAGAEAMLAGRFRSTSGDDLRRMRVVDIQTYLADCLNPKVDGATMAHALEARAPLLDHEILEFAMRLPEEWLVERRVGKSFLRRLLYRYVPERLVRRPKQPFNVPLSTWFVRSHRDTVRALEKSEPLMDSGWLRPEGIRWLAETHLTGARNHGQRIYMLLVLEEWLRQR